MLRASRVSGLHGARPELMGRVYLDPYDSDQIWEILVLGDY